MANTYPQFLTRGTSANLANTSIEDGKIRFTTDNGRMYVDYVNGQTSKRFAISDIVTGNTEAQILALQNPEDKLYVSSDTNKLFFKEGNAWENIFAPTPSMSYSDYNNLPDTKLTDGVLRYITDASGAQIDNGVVIADYNPSTAYTKGQYCMYNGVLQKCTAASATGTWDSSKWSSTTVGAELEDVNKIYTVVFDKDDWVASVVSADYPFEQEVSLTIPGASNGSYQAIVVPGDGSAFLSDEEKKLYNNMLFENNTLTAYASETPTADITVQISKRL